MLISHMKFIIGLRYSATFGVFQGPLLFIQEVNLVIHMGIIVIITSSPHHLFHSTIHKLMQDNLGRICHWALATWASKGNLKYALWDLK